MPGKPMDKVTCSVCGRSFPRRDVVCGDQIRRQIRELMRQHVPGWDGSGCVCEDDLGEFRRRYVEAIVRRERKSIDRLEQEVIDTIHRSDFVADDPTRAYDERATFGQRAADAMASFGGSWAFIGVFAVVMVAWIAANGFALLARPFDPYPFILLNLILSCLAAIQAPVIMMSQNRQEAKDRLHADNDYKTNLKAEIEIRMLHEKLDHLLTSQWQRMAELQQMQAEVLESIRKKLRD
jgi:uncharacterized membrane protein